MLRSKYERAKTKYDYMDLSSFFSHVFLIFNYGNFDIGLFVLRSSVSVQVSKKIFGI